MYQQPRSVRVVDQIVLVEHLDETIYVIDLTVDNDQIIEQLNELPDGFARAICHELDLPLHAVSYAFRDLGREFIRQVKPIFDRLDKTLDRGGINYDDKRQRRFRQGLR